MAHRSWLLSFASLTFIAGGFTACGFGDDERGQPIEPEVDAPPVDAPPIDAPPIDAPPTPRVFEVMPNPPTAIPDNSVAGVSVPFTVTGVSATTGLDVQVDVAHTFSGDIVIELRRGNTTPPTIIKTLRNRAGGTTNDIKETYNLTPAELGTPLNDAYSVHFSDRSELDAGTINLVKLTFKVN
jgi:subtilisin-like proprotein convertase family protein